MRYVYGRDERGLPIDVADPLAARYAQLAAEHRDDPRAFGTSLLGLEAIFGRDLPSQARFTQPVLDALDALFADGAVRTVQRWHAQAMAS